MIKIYHAHWDAIYIPESNKGRITMFSIVLASECNETARGERLGHINNISEDCSSSKLAIQERKCS